MQLLPRYTQCFFPSPNVSIGANSSGQVANGQRNNEVFCRSAGFRERKRKRKTGDLRELLVPNMCSLQRGTVVVFPLPLNAEKAFFCDCSQRFQNSACTSREGSTGKTGGGDSSSKYRPRGACQHTISGVP